MSSGVQREACALCGAPCRRTRHSDAAFRECERCGYAVLTEEDGRSDYWDADEDAASISGFWQDAKRRYFSSALELLGQQAPGRRLIDIGGGVGYFVELALRRGWDAYSLDISPKASAMAAQRLGESRSLTSLPDHAARSFDVVTLWCVVAHTRTPSTLIDLAARALRPGGVLWLTTPNFSFQKPYASALTALRWRLDFAAQDHVGHFTPSAVRALLTRNGFAPPAFFYRGITEVCCGSGSNRPSLLLLKRMWNRGAFAASQLGLPSYLSELQVAARLPR